MILRAAMAVMMVLTATVKTTAVQAKMVTRRVLMPGMMQVQKVLMTAVKMIQITVLRQATELLQVQPVLLWELQAEHLNQAVVLVPQVYQAELPNRVQQARAVPRELPVVRLLQRELIRVLLPTVLKSVQQRASRHLRMASQMALQVQAAAQSLITRQKRLHRSVLTQPRNRLLRIVRLRLRRMMPRMLRRMQRVLRQELKRMVLPSLLM